MKKIQFYTIILLLLSSNLLLGQGIKFFEGSWEEAIKEAKKTDKLIFVDAYTSWCGPCRNMQNNIFTHKKVGDFYNQNFINLKINMETQKGIKFGLNFPVSAYPTILFINHKDELVTKSVGGKSIDEFLELGEKALKSYDKSADLNKEWEKGNRNYQFVLKYVKELRKVNKPTNKVALEYLRAKPDISKDEKAVLIYEATTECDSKLFEMMTKKKNLRIIKDIYSKEELSDKIYSSCRKTVEKSFDYDVPELKDEALQTMKKYCKKRYKEFKIRISLLESKRAYDIDQYVENSEKYFSILDDSKQKIKLIKEITNTFPNQKKIKDLAEELSRKNFKKDKTASNYAFWIKALIANEKNEKASEEIGKAIKMAKDQNDKEAEKTLNRYRFYLEKEVKKK